MTVVQAISADIAPLAMMEIVNAATEGAKGPIVYMIDSTLQVGFLFYIIFIHTPHMKVVVNEFSVLDTRYTKT